MIDHEIGLHRRAGLHWRFSLGEILVAVAIDGVLAASVLDILNIMNGKPTSFVYYTVVAVTFGVFPFVVIPTYWLTYGFRVRRFRGWHNPRNSALMLLDTLVISVAAVYIVQHDSNRTRHLQLIASFAAIAYTMFLIYTIIVDYLKRGRRPGEPAPDRAAALTPVDPAQVQFEPVPNRGPHPGELPDVSGHDAH